MSKLLMMVPPEVLFLPFIHRFCLKGVCSTFRNEIEQLQSEELYDRLVKATSTHLFSNREIVESLSMDDWISFGFNHLFSCNPSKRCALTKFVKTLFLLNDHV